MKQFYVLFSPPAILKLYRTVTSKPGMYRTVMFVSAYRYIPNYNLTSVINT